MSSLFRYVALGDSSGLGIGAEADGGYPERLWRKLRGSGLHAGILNLCQSGATSADLVTRQLERGVSRRPALVTVGIGTNDVWRLVPSESFAENIGRTAEALEATGAHVVVCNIIDLAHAPAAAAAVTWLGLGRAQVTDRVREFNSHLASLAKRPRFHVVDLFSFSQRELPAHPEYFCPDGFHPSRAGYDRWADLCWPAVERAASEWAASQVSAAS
ncbi:MAG TPA: SGNH/GDSL hydrolase family protein [Myxococcaceae bacterium]|nr:SGNH/GDSL hydrolase family protein [Myxococcaceae bacterium]